MYIFIDESGNFQGDKEKLFIVGGFITGDQRATAKTFRKWQDKKFTSKKLKFRREVKFTDTRLTDKLRAQTLLYLTQQNIRVFYSFLKSKNIPLEFRKKGAIESGRLYTEIIAKTLDIIFPSAEPQVILSLDHRSLKKVSQKEFKENLRLHILLRLSKKASVYVNTVDSSADSNIQIADWICGALYRYYTNRSAGEEFYKILHSSIIASEELFKDCWKEFNKKIIK